MSLTLLAECYENEEDEKRKREGKGEEGGGEEEENEDPLKNGSGSEENNWRKMRGKGKENGKKMKFGRYFERKCWNPLRTSWIWNEKRRCSYHRWRKTMKDREANVRNFVRIEGSKLDLYSMESGKPFYSKFAFVEGGVKSFKDFEDDEEKEEGEMDMEGMEEEEKEVKEIASDQETPAAKEMFSGASDSVEEKKEVEVVEKLKKEDWHQPHINEGGYQKEVEAVMASYPHPLSPPIEMINEDVEGCKIMGKEDELRDYQVGLIFNCPYENCGYRDVNNERFIKHCLSHSELEGMKIPEAFASVFGVVTKVEPESLLESAVVKQEVEEKGEVVSPKNVLIIIPKADEPKLKEDDVPTSTTGQSSIEEASSKVTEDNVTVAKSPCFMAEKLTKQKKRTSKKQKPSKMLKKAAIKRRREDKDSEPENEVVSRPKTRSQSSKMDSPQNIKILSFLRPTEPILYEIDGGGQIRVPCCFVKIEPCQELEDRLLKEELKRNTATELNRHELIIRNCLKIMERDGERD